MERLSHREVNVFGTEWKLLAVMGVLSIVLGIVVIATSFVATLATVFFLGCLLLAAGIVHFIASFGTHEVAGFFGHLLAAILYSVAGWYMMAHPAITALSLTLVIGMLLAVGGLYQILSALIMRYASWGWGVLHGLISIALAVAIFYQWPLSALWFIGLCVGVDFIFRGWAGLMLALAARDELRPALERLRREIEERRTGARDRRLATAS